MSYGITATLGRAEIVKHLAIINYRSRTSNHLNMIIKKPKKKCTSTYETFLNVWNKEQYKSQPIHSNKTTLMKVGRSPLNNAASVTEVILNRIR
jgi:hypothetical protein